MIKIVIIGAGFAGLSAAGKLSASGLDLEVLVFDKKESVDFLPMLPDAIGRGFDPGLLSCGIRGLLPGRQARFIREEVVSLDIPAGRVLSGASWYSYDFLIVSSGSQTNFFGSSKAQEYAYGLNSVSDARALLGALGKNEFDNLVVCGGGYTGLEASTGLWSYCRRRGLRAKITVVERSSRILGPLPEWMKEFAGSNLKEMGIDILTDSVVEDIQPSRVTVSGGRVFDKAVLVWVPGVRTADFIQKLEVGKNAQGRITVDEYLKFAHNCFAAGDAAVFTFNNTPLRMAVQFSIAEGACAADNLIRKIKGLPLVKFHPRDPGFVVPMANNKSCGRVFGLGLKGFLPTLLHYLMCLYRLFCFKNKLRLAGKLFSGGFWRG